jgi:hypothetical protein
MCGTTFAIPTIPAQVDPLKSDADIKEYLIRGSKDPYYSYDTLVDVHFFIRNLRKGGQVNRTGHWSRLFDG